MDPQYVQHLRYKLQKRIARLNSIDEKHFPNAVKQFWNFFTQRPVYYELTELLFLEFPGIEKTVDAMLNGGPPIPVETETEAAATGSMVIKRLAQVDQDKSLGWISWIGLSYSDTGNDREAVETVREVFIEPFYEYIDENLDDQRAMLALLYRYKHRCEWFHRENLWEHSQDNRVAEKRLALDLYAYLYDQGIDFHIEPASIRGEIDLIAAQETTDALLLDAKIFDGDSRGKQYICKAFNQIYTYTQHYNEPFGYLMIYKTTDRDLHFALPSLQYSNIPVFNYNHKTIFFITVDIYPHEKPVSQRPPLEMIEITKENLVAGISDSNQTSE
jgi:hypothetical protein